MSRKIKKVLVMEITADVRRGHAERLMHSVDTVEEVFLFSCLTTLANTQDLITMRIGKVVCNEGEVDLHECLKRLKLKTYNASEQKLDKSIKKM